MQQQYNNTDLLDRFDDRFYFNLKSAVEAPSTQPSIHEFRDDDNGTRRRRRWCVSPPLNMVFFDDDSHLENFSFVRPPYVNEKPPPKFKSRIVHANPVFNLRNCS